MAAIVGTLANKRHTGTARSTAMNKRQRNFGPVRGAVCNLKALYTAAIIRKRANKQHTANGRRVRR